MAVRSTELVLPVALTTTAQLVIPGTSGRTYIVKTLAAYNSSASTRRVQLYANGDAAGDTILDRSIAAGDTLLITELFLVVTLNWDLLAKSNGAGVVLSMFGANLEGDPS